MREVSPLAIRWKARLGKTIYLMSSSLDFLKNCIISKYVERDGEIAALDLVLSHKVRLTVKLKAK